LPMNHIDIPGVQFLVSAFRTNRISRVAQDFLQVMSIFNVDCRAFPSFLDVIKLFQQLLISAQYTMTGHDYLRLQAGQPAQGCHEFPDIGGSKERVASLEEKVSGKEYSLLRKPNNRRTRRVTTQVNQLQVHSAHVDIPSIFKGVRWHAGSGSLCAPFPDTLVCQSMGNHWTIKEMDPAGMIAVGVRDQDQSDIIRG